MSITKRKITKSLSYFLFLLLITSLIFTLSIETNTTILTIILTILLLLTLSSSLWLKNLKKENKFHLIINEVKKIDPNTDLNEVTKIIEQNKQIMKSTTPDHAAKYILHTIKRNEKY